MQEIILHLGAHRTASTHVQGVMGKNIALLAAAGIVAPHQDGIHQALTKKLGADTPLAADIFAQFLQAHEAQSAQTLVLSDENILGFLNSIFTHGAFYPDTQRRLHRLRQILPQPPRKIIFSIRPYESFFASAYGRWISPNRPTLARHDLAALILSLKRGWQDVAADIAQVFPESELAFSEYSAQPEYGPAQLSKILGPLADQLVYNPDYRWNRSMSAHQTALYEQAVQAADPERAAEIRTWKRFKQPPLIDGFWPETAQKSLQTRYKTDLAALERQYPAFVTAARFESQDAP